MNKKRLEFLYDKRTDMTTIYIWQGTHLIDKLEMPGQMTSYSKKKREN